MAFPSLAILLRKRPKVARIPTRRPPVKVPKWRWWPRTASVYLGSGGFKLGGALAAQPLIALHIIPVGGVLIGGGSSAVIALHLTGSGGMKMGGSSEQSHRLLTAQMNYEEVTSDVPSINPDAVVSTTPWEPV